MFARIFALVPLAALLVSASPLEARDHCDAGTISCCNSVQTVVEVGSLLSLCGLLDVALGVGGLVGLNCSPLTVIGTGEGCTAEQQPVCCSNDDFNGLINIGCYLIDL